MLPISARRLIAGVLCISISVAVTSCSPKETPKSEPALSSTSPSSLQSTQSSAEPSSEQPSKFVTRLTKNGTGLVRNVPPSNFPPFTKPFDESETFDIRWLNCPKYLDANQLENLKAAVPYISFNSDTVWPKGMPSGYDPSAIMETGKNPGLGVRALHSKGITGKGVSIAIIDEALFTDHPEYKDNLALYEEIHVLPNGETSMHASAVSSIAVGKTCGVAPDAKLYYWGVNFEKEMDNNPQDGSDAHVAFADGLAVAIDRILEVNADLPENEKIRVLSISRGFDNLEDAGVQTFLKAVKRAQEAGIFVITTSTYEYYDFMSRDTDFAGLGKKDITANPDNLSTYTLGRFEQENPENFLNKLLLPMDGRTTADPAGKTDYAFYYKFGLSWSVPYLAGLYALSAQVKADITPQLFWKTAIDTSSQLTVTINNKQYTFKHVINPTKLIASLK